VWCTERDCKLISGPTSDVANTPGRTAQGGIPVKNFMLSDLLSLQLMTRYIDFDMLYAQKEHLMAGHLYHVIQPPRMYKQFSSTYNT